MKYYVGVDLGSTTCKAVVVDEEGRVVGRGLTNTRSNYKAATDVAEFEAKLNARFYLFEQEMLQHSTIGRDVLERLLADFEQWFRYEQYLAHLHALEGKLTAEVPHLPPAAQAEVGRILGEMNAQLERDAYEFYKEMGKDKARFFRDLVGSQYMKLAEGYPRYLELLMGVFDKSILLVENELLDMNVKVMAQNALRTVARAMDVSTYHLDIKLAFQNASAIRMDVRRKVGTGYGRQHLPYPKEQIQSEILCHGLGAHHMFPGTHTILDIGGQDTKAIQLDEDGIVSSFFMNDRCAAGTGRFLGYIADELNIGLHELGPIALGAAKPLKIASTCTVFAGVELRERLSLGDKREEILAGLHQSIVKRAMSLIARSGGVRNEFTFTGGVAKNVAITANVRQMVTDAYGDVAINVSPDSIYTGALGAALFARKAATGAQSPVAAQVTQ
ncbi:MAG: acyl-CoA dehydratase activase [Actinobacteria bacterium]|nr:acyl-CoA dehydratase activase [Actinomycetota bacterium]